MAEDGWSLVFKFPDQSDSFAHGFACGRLWEQMHADRDVIETMMVEETRETVEAMAMSRGWVEEITPVEGGWISVKLSRPA